MSAGEEIIEASGEIAIIGMAGRFPMARNVSEFWQNLRAGRDCIQHFSEQELLAEGIPASLLADPNYVKAWGWMEGVDEFDPEFFNTSAREAELTDPQIRLLLECASETLEDAGLDPERYAGRIGSFVGSAMMHYLWQNLIPTPGLIDSVGYTQAWIVNDRDFLATRLNYKLNLRGPGMTVQSACSTSLVSVHLGVQSLLSGESDVVLAGGVCAPLRDKRGYLYTEGGTMSPDGKVRSFDKDAKGMLGGNGVGLVALKRLEDALREGDNIRAVIKASALNNDGSDKVTYTAPSVDGQSQAIADALDLAGVDPTSISYVEAHGTGTPLGDPIEIAALSQVWCARTEERGWCPIGSVKSNVGHLDTAAGVAGLIKSVLQLEHRELVPSLHFKEANPAIVFSNSPFFVNTKLVPWDTERLPRRSTVSSLGMGGTNAHVILEEAPEAARSGAGRAHSLVLLSARDAEALEAGSKRLGEHLAACQDALQDVAYTTQVGRKFFDLRGFVVAAQHADAASAFASGAATSARAIAGAGSALGAPKSGRTVAFLFSGQGSQHIGMGSGLYGTEAVFSEAFDACRALLTPLIGADLKQLIWGADASPERLSLTQFTQPALFAIEYALAQQWMAWGVQPAAMLGHSIGEFVAAHLAGVFSLEDALKLVAERGRLMGELPAGGGMLAVHAAEVDLAARLGSQLSIAAFNAEQLTVLSGPLDALDALAEELQAAGIASRMLQTSHGFHSALMDPMLDAFGKLLESVTLNAPSSKLISCSTGLELTAEDAQDPQYWVRHLREPVRFGPALRTLDHDKHVLLEVGPGQALASLVQLQSAAREKDALAAIASMRHPKQPVDDQAQLLAALGSLWAFGAAIDWARFASSEKRRKVSLPGYAFRRRKLWIERPSPTQAGAQVPEHKGADMADWFHVPSWELLAPAIAEEHGEAGRGKDWLVFDDGSPECADLIAQLRQNAASLSLVRRGTAFTSDAQGFCLSPERADDFTRLVAELSASAALPDEVLYCWARGAQAEDATESAFFSLMFLAQALGGRAGSGEELRLSVWTEGMYSVLGQGALRPELRTCLGICMSINLELEGVSARVVDLEPGIQDTKALLAELGTALEHPLVALLAGKRWAQRFVPTRLPVAEEQSFGKLQPGAVVWITGGLGGIGLTLAEDLAKHAKAKLVLLSRAGLPGEEASRATRAVRALQSHGAEVLVLAADVSDEASLRSALAATLERFGSLDAVIHAAGVAGAGLLELKTREQAQAVLAAKLQGTRVLRRILEGRRLDFVLLCSSISSVCAGLGQADYFAANAFLDATAEQWRAESGLAVTAINWDAWSEVGMAVETKIPAEMEADRAAILSLGLTNAEALQACKRVLASDLPQVVVSPRKLTSRADYRLRYDFEFLRQTLRPAPSQESGEAVSAAASGAPARASSPRPALANAYVEPSGATEVALAAIWGDLLGLDQVGRQDNFFGLGGNSLVMMQVGVRLRERFGMALPIRELFELITIAELAATIDGVRGALQASEDAAGAEEDEETEEFTL